AALHLACEAAGLTAGEEVLCPALTFVASANAILYTGARPVFVDILGPRNLNLSAADAASKITERSRAIMVVHYAGYPCDLDAIRDLAQRYGLAIIEDCAHAPGAVYHSGDGLNSNKNMTTGEGGMVVTADDALAQKIKIARSHGMTSLTWDRHKGHSFSYDVVARGYNYRLDEMRAALGLAQLQRLEVGNDRRRQLTGMYQEKLKPLPQLEIPFLGVPEGSAHHIFPVLLKDGALRPAFMSHLAKEGIQTSIHYPPIHHFTYYRQLWPPDFNHCLPHTEAVAGREVTLPLFPAMTSTQLELVVQSIFKFFA
ncbi:MAG: DegT/DnrJ/EryC1/StrS family aminotransferase, partial [Deltaproteobacteria bacterium]|nr:DegT/DnrJ/EryC1/StrS family aminotransferase [Deltaproteobacteria bacterium]